MALHTCSICGRPWTRLRWQPCRCAGARPKAGQHWVAECDRCQVSEYEPVCTDPSAVVSADLAATGVGGRLIERGRRRLRCIRWCSFSRLGSQQTAELHAWGREQRTGWWALLSWRHPIRRPGRYSQVVSVAARVAAEHVRPSRDGTDTSTVPRLRLSDDQTQWPTDRLRPRWDGTYLGAWSGGPLPLPEATDP